MPLESLLLLACLVLSVGSAGVALSRWRSAPVQSLPIDFPPATVPRDQDWWQRWAQRLPGVLTPGLLGMTLLALFLLVLNLCLSWWGVSMGLALVAASGLSILSLMLLLDLIGLRTRRFEQHLLDAVSVMTAALGGGLSAQAALQAAARGAQGQAGPELKELARRIDRGIPPQQALSRLKGRYDCESVRLFSQALVAKWNAGPAFRELLEAVSKLMRDRLKARDIARGQLSGARYAAWFAGALPYLLIPLFLWRQPAWLDVLLAHPQGPLAIVLAALCQATGLVWLRQILRVSL
ncbi:MAG: type II secretion system F family protein [Oceanococcaceae bacterium]